MASEMILVPRDKWERMTQSSQEVEKKKTDGKHENELEEEKDKVAEGDDREKDLYDKLYSRLMTELNTEKKTRKKKNSKEKQKRAINKNILEDLEAMEKSPQKPQKRHVQARQNRLPPPGIPERKIPLDKLKKRDLTQEPLTAIKGWELYK